MTLRSLRALAVLAVLGVAAPALAAPVEYVIDPNHSQVGFKIRHFFAKTPGQFNKFSGSITHDADDLAASKVEVSIDAASIDTNQERRDNDLRSANFFHTDSFPTITFRSRKVVPAGEKKFKVEGDLTIRGVTKPVVLDAEFLGAADIGIGGRSMSKAGFAATTTIDRKDFGITWNRSLDQGGVMLGDDVEIAIQIEADRKKPEAAATGK